MKYILMTALLFSSLGNAEFGPTGASVSSSNPPFTPLPAGPTTSESTMMPPTGGAVPGTSSSSSITSNAVSANQGLTPPANSFQSFHYNPNTIQVSLRNGQLILQGTAASQAEADEVLQNARAANRSSTIINNITVSE